MAGAMTSRAEAQVMRLAMIYALLDCSEAIRVEHLEAALAVWQYAEASVNHVFGGSAGHEHNTLVDWIAAHGDSVTVSELTHAWRRYRGNATAAQVDLDDLE